MNKMLSPDEAFEALVQRMVMFSMELVERIDSRTVHISYYSALPALDSFEGFKDSGARIVKRWFDPKNFTAHYVLRDERHLESPGELRQLAG
jgi:hypothetical protein